MHSPPTRRARCASNACCGCDRVRLPNCTATPTGFTVTGYTYSHPSVARLMRRLSLVPWLSDVSLVSSAKTAIANRTIYQFTVGASVASLPEVGQ